MRRSLTHSAAKKAVGLALLAGVVIFCSGCSSFRREWKTALAHPLPSDGISGPWEGQWISSKNGHRGQLRCVMKEKSAGEYEAHFHAVFWKILRASYKVPFRATRVDDHWTFEGESDLGKLAGGLYTYTGTASASNFTADYDSKYDHGKFEMTRPTAPTSSRPDDL